jgi:ABC-2 type transport system ATP-binding protein
LQKSVSSVAEKRSMYSKNINNTRKESAISKFKILLLTTLLNRYFITKFMQRDPNICKESTVDKHEQNAIMVQHLNKKYEDVVAVDDVTFSVKEGEIFGIIGPNGAGKTTIVECISGLRNPDKGTVVVLGLNREQHDKELHEIIGVQIQESSLPPNIKVSEALELFASFYPHHADWNELLSLLRIEDKRNAKFKQLSGGQKQRLSIALALVGNPRIAILDELTTGLDPQARRETWHLIERIREKGVTVILVTHYMDEAERLCDRVALIVHGKIRVADKPSAIATRYGGGTQMRFLPSGSVSDEILTSLSGVTSLEHQGPHIYITGNQDLPTLVIHALDKLGMTAAEIEVHTGNLEEAFVRLTESSEDSIKEVDSDE